ncbi:hypothetical protein [Sphingomonas glaciei]|uniref:DUF2541 family protein n=1 Tax=Sphingomonas glaciei TaxID=2938948 RepID=A0ABY5MVJ7_9SPHN|nr:hypothetical protein [Sphingomonas glaciei]UUR07352.1 hypothetical protein M1K48_10415 [Sphingomonas glaciei]
MNKRMILAAATLATGLAAASPAAAQQWRWNEGNWRTIGTTRVDGRDNDVVQLPGVTRQREIRVCALNAPLRLRDFDIRFANGGRQDVRTRAVLDAGTCTRAVDLRGNRRDVTAVRLRYEPVAPRANRPLVRIQIR